MSIPHYGSSLTIARAINKVRFGQSPVIGYEIDDYLGVTKNAHKANGASLLLREVFRAADGTPAGIGRNVIRLPKDPDDMLAFCQMLLRITHGELSALALTTTVMETDHP